MWSRLLTIKGAAAAFGYSLRATKSGGWLIGGSTKTGSKNTLSSWLLRLDAWGHESCAGAGVCAEPKPPGCDDGNPCTLDVCAAPKKGCSHQPQNDDSPCAASKTCKKGICKN